MESRKNNVHNRRKFFNTREVCKQTRGGRTISKPNVTLREERPNAEARRTTMPETSRQAFTYTRPVDLEQASCRGLGESCADNNLQEPSFLRSNPIVLSTFGGIMVVGPEAGVRRWLWQDDSCASLTATAAQALLRHLRLIACARFSTSLRPRAQSHVCSPQTLPTWGVETPTARRSHSRCKS